MRVKTFFIRGLALLCLLGASLTARAVANDPDLPGFTGNIELIPAGSLVIPMDNALQTNNGTFNMKAYGLVNALLHGTCPVKWAIATGKAKDGIDFTASAAKVLPSTNASGSVSFRAGPFIVHRDFTNIAMPIITGYGKTVSVYRVTADLTVDIRYTVAHMPNVGILDDGGTQGIQTNVLIEAGFLTNHFTVLHATDVAFLSTNSCYTMVCSPHYAGGANATNQAQAIRQFVLDGGNFMAQCAAVDTYENNPVYGHFQTTIGVVSNKNVSGGSPFNYTNNDMAFNQYQGAISNQTGYVEEYNLKANSLFTNNFYPCVVSSTTTTNFRASVSKLVPGVAGSVLFYLGGHDYFAGDTNILNVNGRRMMLNTIFIPMNRPASCLITFQTDLGITMSSNGSITNGQNVTYTVIATNYGSGRVSGAPILVNFSSSLSNVTWTAAVTGGASVTNASGNGSINQNINIPINGSVVYTVHGTLIPTATCSITNSGTIAVPTGMIDSRLTNNSTTSVDRIFPAFTRLTNANYSCASQVPVAATNVAQFTAQGGSIAATCCPGSTTVGFSDSSNGGAGCPASPLVINRTYQITTGCGDSRQALQTLTITDSTPPTITCPTNITVPAINQVPAPNPALVSGSDNCSAVTNRWVSDSPVTNGAVITITRTYSTTDACGNSNTCNQTITVDPGFHAPTANNDTYTATEDITLIVPASGVLTNDTDPLSLPLKAVLVSTTTHGTLTFNTNGGFTYVPAANYNGPDSFTYKANNGPSDSSNATVTISVQPVNDVPTFTKGANVTVNEDGGPQTIPNWATVISSGPPDESGQTLNFIVSNNNSNLFTVQPFVSTNGTLTFTPAPDSNGVITVTISLHDNGGTNNGGVDTSGTQTFTITVNPVNDPPTFNPLTNSIPSPNGTNSGPGTVTVFEDAGPQSFTSWITGISPGPANESSQTVAFTVSNNNSSIFSVQPAIAANGTLTFTGATNAFGSATITVFARDNGGTANGGNDTSTTQTFTVILLPVNDPPSFIKGADQTVNEDAPAQSIPNWATAISPGPANESAQTVSFTVTNNNNALFSVQPSIDASGTLTYTLRPASNGVATVTVIAHDNGGTANGGVDTSAPQTFIISAISVNDPPSFALAVTNEIVLEDCGPQVMLNVVTNISAGPPNEIGQTLTFTVTNSNPAMFVVQPAINAAGTLVFTPAANSNGVVSVVSVVLHDNGGTNNGGVDTSPPQTFSITILPVNDPPSFTKGADVTVNEDSGAQSMAGWATGISVGPPNESSQSVNFIVSNDNNSLFSVQPSVSPNGQLTFTSAPDANGFVTVTIAAHDDGGTANGGVDTSAQQTFTITVNPVNDPPTFNPPTNSIPSPNGTNSGPGTVTVFEDAGPQSFAGWITGTSPGPANESAQTVTFNVSVNNPNLFTVRPAIAADGTLTFTGRGDSNGTAIVTVTAKDNGGTANGGNDTSVPQTFTIILLPVNDVPSFTKGADVTVNEDAGTQTVNNWATNLSLGPPDESSQLINFIVSNNNNGLFSVQPTISTNGTLTFTPATNANGAATVTVTAHDNGGTANGGVDTSASQTFILTVNPVNDPPTFNPPTNSIPSPNGTNSGPGTVTVFEDAGPQSFSGWITGTSPGPANESSQTVTFTVSNNNSNLFAVQPAISTNGTLTFTGRGDSNGIATITVVAHDNGGTANGGNDTSVPQSFTIILLPVNDAPSFTKGPDLGLLEDLGAQTIVNWATGISRGPQDESGQLLNFVVTNDNAGLFSVPPAISASGTLTFTLATNAAGLANITVILHDDGGTANGGVDTSAPQTFSLTVTNVNDPPTFTVGPNQTVYEDIGPQVVPGFINNMSAGPPNESGQTLNFMVSNNNSNMFSQQPSIDASGTLVYTSAPDSNGLATVTVVLHDSGGTNSGGLDTSAPQTFVINVIPVNDAPSFLKGPNITVLEDAPQTSINWATNIKPGPQNESSQVVNFILSNSNTNLFAVQPAINSTGTLTFTPAPNANGTVLVTVFLHDNGGTSLTVPAGVDTSAPQTFNITMTAVNDPPTFNPPTNSIPSPNGTNSGPGSVTVFEDAGPQSFAGWITGISPGPPDESAQIVTFTVSNNNSNLFSVQPAIATDGTLTFTSRGDSNGAATITVIASDNGGTANGGIDTSVPQTFRIIVLPVNDVPSFTKGVDILINNYDGPQTRANWATGLSVGPANESSQALSFIVNNDANSLFAAQPAISANGTLTFAPSTNFGVATVTVAAHDDGGTANGGVDTSAIQTFHITVNNPPIVNIAFPTNNTLYYYGGDIIVTMVADDLDGTVTNVTLLVGTNTLSPNVAGTNGLYIYTWPATNTLPTNYTFHAIATDNRGATNISPPANITLASNNAFTVRNSTIIADPQSGHWIEEIYIFNPTVSILQSVWITFTNLNPSNTIVINATETNELGQPVCGFNPGVLPGQWCTNKIFFATPSTNPPIALYWVRASFGPVAPINIGAFSQAHIDQITFQLHRRVILFFPTVTNGIYWMQYSSNLVNWKTSPLPTIGTGSRSQWIDEGPNATDSFPANEKKRFYRLLLQQ